MRDDISYLIKKVEAVFNLFIRLRDKDKLCICGCGGRVEHAGHFYPTNYSGVRFDEMNVNGQSVRCNCFKNTSAIDPDYREGMIIRYGLEAVEQLEQRAKDTRFQKWSRSELKEIHSTYRNKVKSFHLKNAA